jgi:hypothetical protein
VKKKTKRAIKGARIAVPYSKQIKPWRFSHWGLSAVRGSWSEGEGQTGPTIEITADPVDEDGHTNITRPSEVVLSLYKVEGKVQAQFHGCLSEGLRVSAEDLASLIGIGITRL